MSNWCPVCKKFARLEADQNLKATGALVCKDTLYFSVTVNLVCNRCVEGVRGADYDRIFTANSLTSRIELNVTTRYISKKSKVRLIRVDAKISVPRIDISTRSVKITASEELFESEFHDSVWHLSPW